MLEVGTFAAPVVSAVIGWAVAWLVCRYAVPLRLVSIPNYRSSHSQPKPNGGGLGIVLGSSIAVIWYAWGLAWNGWVLAGLAFVLALVSLVDDIRALPRLPRFAVQLAVVGTMLGTNGILATDTWVPMALLLLVGAWWVNLFNFMDGIDGIAASQAICMLLTSAMLGEWFDPDAIKSPTWQWMLGLAAASAGFLTVNWPPARVFMGDVGSIYLAFVIFGLALMSVGEGWMSYVAWLILGAVFIVDASVTLLRRILSGERWYEGHRSHAYQRLARRLGGHRPVTLIVIAINVAWLAPLAWLSLAQPALDWVILALAYVPLLIVVWMAGAGKRDDIRPQY